MKNLQSDRVFFYIILLLITVVVLLLIRNFIGAVVLALIMSVVLTPMHRWFTRRIGGHKAVATALTLITTLILAVIPTIVGTWILLESFAALSAEVEHVMRNPQPEWMQVVDDLQEWLISTELGTRLGVESDDIESGIRTIEAEASRVLLTWLAGVGLSLVNTILPAIVFISLLGTLLTNADRALQIFKEISPLDDDIDQLFLDRLRIMTKAMMLSIVVVAIAQGMVTGLLMALGGTPHVVPLTIAASILAILPGGAAIIAVPVGIGHLLEGNIRAGLIIIIGTLTLVSAVANQVRPWMVSKDAYLNRAIMLMSVFSGLALFGMMGVVYGPLIMVLFTTMLEVYLQCFRPTQPSVTLASVKGETPGQLASDEAEV